jgi:hypothetical protein
MIKDTPLIGHNPSIYNLRTVKIPKLVPQDSNRQNQLRHHQEQQCDAMGGGMYNASPSERNHWF